MGKIIFIVLLFSIKIFGCTSFWQPTFIQEAEYNFIDNRFLTKEDRNNPLYKYAHISPWAYENRVKYYNNIKKELNIKEWAEYLNISLKDAKEIVYKNKSPLIIQDKSKQKEFIAYKKALDLIGDDTNWKEVLERFRELYKKSKDDFFKTRIAYNIVRAYHHLREFNKELKFIDTLNRTNSIVWEWIDSYRAGAILQMGDRVKSAYLFAKIFATHKSDAYIGYYDFKIKSDKEWNSLINMAKDKQEIILFHFLRAINPQNNELLELKYISEIDADSIWVKRLLYLVSQKAQYRAFLLKDRDYEDFYDLKKEDLEKYIDTFLEYLYRYQKDDFNKYLLSYFEYIYHNKKIPSNVEKSKELIAYLSFIDNLKKINEKEISNRLIDIKQFFKGSQMEKSFERYTIDKLSKLYPKGSLKAKLANYFSEYDKFFDGFDFRANLTLDNLNSLVSLIHKKDKNYIEKLLLSSKEVILDTDLINLYYSVLYTKEGKYKKALEHLEGLSMPPVYYDDIYDGYKNSNIRVSRYNPFNVGFSGNNRDSRKNMRYSHKKFLTTIIKIQDKLNTNPNSIMDNFLMANGLYNISDFGNSPMFAHIYRDTSIVNSKNLDLLEKSEAFYKKVLKLTNNRELKAKVYYQLLKIALDKKMFEYSKVKNNYYLKPNYRELEGIFKLLKENPQYEKLYKELLKYQDTKYYQKIKNCAIFRYFK